jgi:hypothetical protein
VLDKIHSQEPLDTLKQPIKSNLFPVSMEILTLKKPLKEMNSEKLVVKIIKEPIHIP